MMRMEQRQEQQQEWAIVQALRFAVCRLINIITRTDVDFAEFVSGAMGVAWGLWLINPWVNTFASSPGFNSMEALPVPEWVWGVVIASGGSWQVTALLSDHLPSRRLATMGGALTWAFVAIMIGFSNPAAPGVLAYGGYFLCAAWAYVRLAKVEQRQQRRERRGDR